MLAAAAAAAAVCMCVCVYLCSVGGWVGGCLDLCGSSFVEMALICSSCSFHFLFYLVVIFFSFSHFHMFVVVGGFFHRLYLIQELRNLLKKTQGQP